MTVLDNAPFLVPFLSQAFTPQCAKEFSELIFSVFCIKIVLSKLLGYGIIAGSVAVKLPQIIKILKGRSAHGISFFGQLLELIGVSATVAYSISNGFPFSSYGEGIFLSIQTSIIVMLTVYYQKSKSLSFVFITVYALVMSYLCSPVVSQMMLRALMQLNIPIVAAGKLSQVWINYKNGTTGQLSAITLIMIFGGSVARIFTTLQETGDFVMAMSFVVAASCNFLLVAQLGWYWNCTDSTNKPNKTNRQKRLKKCE